MPEFKVGDVVTLKSGSPRMTVTSIVREDRVSVTWWSEQKQEMLFSAFETNTLDKVTILDATKY